jgi:succinate-semialdehyde dehydrogenase/glutarate-semialdehyde dehydrogenase
MTIDIRSFVWIEVPNCQIPVEGVKSVSDRAGEILIGGEWRAAADGATLVVHDPATREVLGEVSDGGLTEAAAAVEAAVAAFPSWAEAPAERRAAVLLRLAARLEEESSRFQRLLVSESGKPAREAMGEVASSIAFLRWNAEEARRLHGQTIGAGFRDLRLWTIRQPVGVAAIITPWNYPLNTLCRKLGPALAAGCTVLLKPAPETPLSTVELARLAMAAGIPRGVINLVTTSRAAEVVGGWLADRRVRKIAFTGSTRVGKGLFRDAAATLKRVSLELGGHAPAIVFADADLDHTVENIVASRFRHAGQTCICVQRVIAAASIAAELTARLEKRIARLRVGNGRDPEVEVGPLIHEGARQRVMEHLDDALARGARIVVGGRELNLPDPNRGCFFEPTLLDGVTPQMRVMSEETFGPLLTMSRFQTEAEAISLANATDYGLAAYLFTNDAARIHRLVERLHFGTIGINDTRIIHPALPFGGIGESGIGRENGAEGIDEYLETKAAVLRVPATS